jgi:hypothetical protein
VQDRSKANGLLGNEQPFFVVRYSELMAIDRAALHLTGRFFLDSIEREFPDWIDQLRVADGSNLELEVSQPDGARSLSIRVNDAKISIRYGDWGFVTGTFLGCSEAVLVDDLIEMLRSILSEENVVEITCARGEWQKSSLTWPFFEPEVGAGQVVTIYSWRGTYDRTIEG